jgi:hypothetical protein
MSAKSTMEGREGPGSSRSRGGGEKAEYAASDRRPAKGRPPGSCESAILDSGAQRETVRPPPLSARITEEKPLDGKLGKME